jgi:peptidoglycan/xylan/chitin deacetylase (PgdA/CDA1 family)
MRDKLIFAIKCAAAYLLYGTGLLHAWKWLRFRRSAVVLMYHRVLTAEVAARSWSHPAIIVRRETFERQMRWLRRHFDVLDLERFEACLQDGRSFDAPSCLVTFDDGWYDNYTEAWPILKAHGIPAVIFLPVQFIGTGRMFWQERMKALLSAIRQRADGDAAFAEDARPVLRRLELEAVLDVDHASLPRTLHGAAAARKQSAAPDTVLSTLELLLGEAPDVPADAFMTWDMAREMAGHGIAFGGHSVTHRLLTMMPAAEAAREAAESREAIGTSLGRPAIAFAYPNGSFDAGVKQGVRGAAYRLAFAVTPGPVGAGVDRFAVPRINIHEDMTAHQPLFLARVLGVL